ncbi:hypothetical protein [Sinosporangium siamense]|uniref:hypothetical protein n=1 Tax=Sinosporangium siamense TaxID=1367973 RepID=UPI0019510749|nr:hypothetical protein [Sinosporangium siamense]
MSAATHAHARRALTPGSAVRDTCPRPVHTAGVYGNAVPAGALFTVATAAVLVPAHNQRGQR